ncbi:MAG: glucose 1-dehydrogenase [Acidimicrobiales bacterium]|nr:glucose 1-dehydrogenase [Acidimicrobiales bacterium]MYA26859.1 glucose 1-dehydrogenase [Acidimicrobiales bacterium]MYD83369.1 glucose 1-dehydrogenase [Acidimicrobiales bacterium]MYI28168.1 glucose 1-dehydrogenase [Acidimicrobiales bacterium]MYJ64307.1 glucose 1-dehydrogenase [Acidimicrobiales bacterium]
MASGSTAPHGAASSDTAGRMEGKVAVITGGASGIGRACGLRFASEGASIVVADLNPDRAASVVDEINALGSDAIAVQVDTSQQEQNDAMADAAVDTFGRIDACVAAAGISHSGYVSREIEDQAGQDRFDRGDMFFIDKSLESWQRVLDVNLTGVMLTNQAVARKMRDNDGGAIVNISSIAGTNVLKGSSDYCVSKAGVWMLTRCAALELSRYSIRVNAVGPGYIQTSMSGAVLGNERWVQARERETPLGRLGEPGDIANACLYLCSDDASFVTGEIIFPDGGVMAAGR